MTGIVHHVWCHGEPCGCVFDQVARVRADTARMRDAQIARHADGHYPTCPISTDDPTCTCDPTHVPDPGLAREYAAYDRRHAATITHFHAGHNVSGYLPESDEFNAYETWHGALSALCDDLERAWDDGTDAQFLEAHTEIHGATPGQDFLTYTATNPDSDHDLPTAWWVTSCTESECTTEDQATEFEFEFENPQCFSCGAPAGSERMIMLADGSRMCALCRATEMAGPS
jgi:hypothetical protein